MLTTYHFLFVTEVITPLELDEHSGAALRGNLFESVWRRFCTNRTSPSCAACPLHIVCPVSALVAPLREESQRGRDIPRPYIILPPLGDTRRYEPGQELTFGLTLFGSIIQLLPYLVMSVNTLEEIGLGRRLPENRGMRGQFRIRRIEAYHPFTNERHCIYQRGKPLVEAPTLSITEADVVARAASLSTEQLTLDFLTPVRIIELGKPVLQLSLRSLLMRLSERFASLEKCYGGASEASQDEDGEHTEQEGEQVDLISLAKGIAIKDDQTRWEDVTGYSRRQQNFTSTSGFLGRITFVGDLAPFRELLTWGELVHVGKNVVKGNGWYRIVTEG